MLKRLRPRLNYANVVATLALFFALSGGAAYAASHYLITSTKQIKPSVLASLKGRAGQAGTPGANGTTGAPGGPGEKGPQGSPGSNGTNGSNGKSAATVSFEGSKEPAGEPCKKQGGTSVEVEGSAKPSYACNGETGFTETLPSGKSEHGMWAFSGKGQEENETESSQRVAISFPIPLQESLNPEHVHFVLPGEEAPHGCTGGTVHKPTAEPGNLCVYASVLGGGPVHLSFIENLEAATFIQAEGAVGKSGGVMQFAEAVYESAGEGDWVVTAK